MAELTSAAVTQAAAEIEASMVKPVYICYRKMLALPVTTEQPKYYFLGTTVTLEDAMARCQHNADVRNIELDWTEPKRGIHKAQRRLTDFMVEFIIMKSVHRPEGYDMGAITEKEW